MSSSAAHPRRTDAPAALDDERRVTAALEPLVHALLTVAPSGPAGDAARAPLQRLLATDPAHRRAALPIAYAQFEAALADESSDPETLHDELRALIRSQHADMLHDPGFAQVIEAPHRRANMLSWLLRENVGRLEQLNHEVAHQAAETERLRHELSRLEAERQLLLSELDHSRALADVGLMTAGVAHDFNNLLQAITGHTVMALSALPDDHAERPSLDRALAAAERAAELTRRLMSWARPSESSCEPIDLSRIAAEVLDLIAPSAPPKVLLQRLLSAELPMVLADATELRRVVLNLVVNAWQAIGGHPGEVRVSTGVTEGRTRMAWIEVQDDGHGMDEATRERLFEPFFSGRPEGHGLGLPTVSRITEKLGGKVEVWSEPGHGARFRVSLPAMPQRPA